jgi:hypothetical protein
MACAKRTGATASRAALSASPFAAAHGGFICRCPSGACHPYAAADYGWRSNRARTGRLWIVKAGNTRESTRGWPIRATTRTLFRLREPARRACLHGAVSRCRDHGGAQPEICLRHARHADDRRAGRRDRRAGRIGRHHHRAVGAGRRHHPAARLPVGRRPHADRRFGLSPHPPFRRHHAEAAGRRGRVLRSACRRRHRRADEGPTPASSSPNRPAPTPSRCRTSRRSPRPPRRAARP